MICNAGKGGLSDAWCVQIAAVSKGVHQAKCFVHGNNWRFLSETVTVQQIPVTATYRHSMPALFGSAKEGQVVQVFVNEHSNQLLPVSEDAMHMLAWALKRTQISRAKLDRADAVNSLTVLKPYTKSDLLHDLRMQVEVELNISTDAKRRGFTCSSRAPHIVAIVETCTCQGMLPSKDTFIGGRLIRQQEVCGMHRKAIVVWSSACLLIYLCNATRRPK